MSREHETVGWVFLILALILLAIYLLRNRLGSSTTTVTTSNGQPIYQQCFAIDGSPFYWRADQGRCPMLSTSGQT